MSAHYWASVIALETATSLFRPCLCLNPQAPGLHPPDEPGVFFFKEVTGDP
jgi:hypothetical protein